MISAIGHTFFRSTIGLKRYNRSKYTMCDYNRARCVCVCVCVCELAYYTLTLEFEGGLHFFFLGGGGTLNPRTSVIHSVRWARF